MSSITFVAHPHLLSWLLQIIWPLSRLGAESASSPSMASTETRYVSREFGWQRAVEMLVCRLIQGGWSLLGAMQSGYDWVAGHPPPG
ncbi:hypothetical protein MLD38_000799 [Melastoma candidum]|uniref:Uncharacterized protein n=1 Tax=Melastoma candidum TaxID=119954 RepID=A0ACB9SEJ9_9MYRT|nr:hypothetical protein MLD38_000799 [Melastoma candidum]